jgi:hypothetical protein
MGHGIDAIVDAACVLHLLTFEGLETAVLSVVRVRMASMRRRP